MPQIILLPKDISELIAAGEVVERPASVVKELIENSIDALSKHITVEISRGGVSLIRITDDGCGISPSDVPLAFKRHATSKIKSADDLNAISTLGFRGEALAATCCVSRTELFTKTSDSELGTHYVIEGGEEKVYEESGCPQGTTLIIRDLFYNTPARMKFLKKDSTEATAVSAVVEREALAHPEIAFKLIRDGKVSLSTSGDGDLYSAIYSVLGRDFAETLIKLNSSSGSVKVTGYVSKPVYCRPSRAGQYTFLNGRFIRSATVCAAAEQAYKNSSMIGKFPAFTVSLEIPAGSVDVNVHPAKTEVRFSDEKLIFNAVYYAVKSAIAALDTRPELLKQKSVDIGVSAAEKYTQQPITAKNPIINTPADSPSVRAEKAESPTPFEDKPLVLRSDTTPVFEREDVKRYINQNRIEAANFENTPETPPVYPASILIERTEDVPEVKTEEKPSAAKSETPIADSDGIKYIGEAFLTYIIVQKNESIFLIDKHAAHERIIFNRLKESENTESQNLLSPEVIRLSGNELDAVLSNLPLLSKAGFDIEDFGSGSVIVRSVPSMLSDSPVGDAVIEAAESLCQNGSVTIEKLENLYHTVACKAAMKAGYITPREEQLSLAKQVLEDNSVMYCPHGRPVAFEIKKKELEKQFGRIQ